MSTTNQWSAALMSIRAAFAAIILTTCVTLLSLIPDRPDSVRRLGLFWLAVYTSAMLAQAAWVGWRWLSGRRRTSA